MRAESSCWARSVRSCCRGVQAPEQGRKLGDSLRAFPDVRIDSEDHETAASCFNRCGAKAIQGSNTDFLICAVALRLNASILTTDADIERFSGVLRVRLRPPR